MTIASFLTKNAKYKVNKGCVFQIQNALGATTTKIFLPSTVFLLCIICISVIRMHGIHVFELRIETDARCLVNVGWYFKLTWVYLSVRLIFHNRTRRNFAFKRKFLASKTCFRSPQVVLCESGQCKAWRTRRHSVILLANFKGSSKYLTNGLE